MKDSDQTNNANISPEFVSLLSANQRMIFAYIMSLVPNVNDADDILQETVQVMMKKFNQFELGTNFLAWASTIAYYRVLDFRKEKVRRGRIFNDEIFNQLHSQTKSQLQNLDEYMFYLKECMQKLSIKDFELIKLRYMDNQPVKKIAFRFGRSVQSVYRSIARIQNLLRHCIKKQLIS